MIVAVYARVATKEQLYNEDCPKRQAEMSERREDQSPAQANQSGA